MEQVRPLTSLSTDELIARIEQYVVVLELRDAEIRELDAANSALLAERDVLREALKCIARTQTKPGDDKAALLLASVINLAFAELAQEHS